MRMTMSVVVVMVTVTVVTMRVVVVMVIGFVVRCVVAFSILLRSCRVGTVTFIATTVTLIVVAVTVMMVTVMTVAVVTTMMTMTMMVVVAAGTVVRLNLDAELLLCQATAACLCSVFRARTLRVFRESRIADGLTTIRLPAAGAVPPRQPRHVPPVHPEAPLCRAVGRRARRVPVLRIEALGWY